MISKHWQIQPHLQSSVLNHFNTLKIISIMLKLYPATLFRIGCCNLDAVTLSTESSHYFLMNNCSWNHPKICIAHSLSEKNNTFSASWEDFIGLQSTAWSPVSHPAAEHCKGPTSSDRSSLWSLRVSAAKALLRSWRWHTTASCYLQY